MTPDAPQPPAPPPRPAPRASLLRLALLLALTAALFVVARATGLSDRVSVEQLRAWMLASGALGVVLFAAAFSAGLLLHLPGWMFVAAAVLAYGRLRGGFLSFVSAVIAVSVTFLFVRLVGGEPLAAVERPLFKRVLSRLDDRPLQTVIALRILFFMTSLVNYTLGLSRLRFRDYLLGSAIGLVIPILVETLAVDQIIRWKLGAGP